MEDFILGLEKFFKEELGVKPKRIKKTDKVDYSFICLRKFDD